MAETEDHICPPVTMGEIMPTVEGWMRKFVEHQALPCLVVGRTRQGLMFIGPPSSIQPMDEVRDLLIDLLYQVNSSMGEGRDVGLPRGLLEQALDEVKEKIARNEGGTNGNGIAGDAGVGLEPDRGGDAPAHG